MKTYVYIKELLYNGYDNYTALETIRSKDPTIFEALKAIGNIFDGVIPFGGNLSKIAKMQLLFYKPDPIKSYFACDKILVDLSKKVKTFDKTIGCWPFDTIDLLDFPESKETMENIFGVTNYRLIAFEE